MHGVSVVLGFVGTMVALKRPGKRLWLDTDNE